MMKNYAVTSVPNTQSFPDNAYPASAYYGINSTLADMTSMSASGNAGSTPTGAQSGATASLMPYQTNIRGLILVFVIVLAVIALWHWYYK